MIYLRQHWRTLLNWLAWITAGVFFFLAFQRLLEQDNWQIIYRTAHWTNFIVACGFLLVGLFFRSLSGWVAHTGLRYPLTIEQSYRFWFLSQLSKYIPGGVWQFATRGSLYTQNGMPPLTSAAVILWETAIILLVGIFMVASSGIAVTANNRMLLIGVTIGLLVMIWLTQARWFWKLLADRQLPLSQRILTTIDQLGTRRYQVILSLSGLALVGWIFINIGFHFVVLTFVPDQSIGLAQTFFAYPLAWIIGFIVIIAPGGLGVREIVLVAFFSQLVGESVAIMISMMSRLWWMLAEGLHISLTLILSMLNRRKEPVA